MGRKKKEEGGGPTGNEWLGTYSDMVTLLMTLFVLLYSMSSVDAEKVQAISEAFSVMSGKSADSIMQYDMYQGKQPVIGGESKVEDSIELSDDIEEQTMYEKVSEFIEKNKLDASIEVSDDKKGIVLQLRDDILFESGKADLIPSSFEVLDKIGELLASINNPVVIEGHTDNDPISNSNYKDNWDLSSARATNVLRYFTVQKHLDPTYFSAAGYGEYKPKAQNTTEENKAKNRRVNILIHSNAKEE